LLSDKVFTNNLYWPCFVIPGRDELWVYCFYHWKWLQSDGYVIRKWDLGINSNFLKLELNINQRFNDVRKWTLSQMTVLKNRQRQILTWISKKAIVSKVNTVIYICLEFYCLFILLCIENFSKPVIILVYNKLGQVSESQPITLLSYAWVLSIILFHWYKYLIPSIPNKEFPR
jgi:hypothetical protein